MSFSDDIRDAKSLFSLHVKAFKKLFRNHRIFSTATAWEALSSASLRKDMVELAEHLVKAERGKLTFTTAFASIGAAFGGVRVAAMGGATEVPLALLGASVGLVSHCTQVEPFIPHVKLGSSRYPTRRFKRDLILKFIDDQLITRLKRT